MTNKEYISVIEIHQPFYLLEKPNRSQNHFSNSYKPRRLHKKVHANHFQITEFTVDCIKIENKRMILIK